MKVGGMHCSLCTESIHKALARVDGVRTVQVSIAHEEALVEYEPGRVDQETIRETLEDIGYTVREPDQEEIFQQRMKLPFYPRRGVVFYFRFSRAREPES